jgi:predicted dehydrogenase
MSPGDAVIIFVPDDLHARVAIAAAQRRLHVLVAKPAVQTLDEHRQLLDAVTAAGVLVGSCTALGGREYGGDGRGILAAGHLIVKRGS